MYWSFQCSIMENVVLGSSVSQSSMGHDVTGIAINAMYDLYTSKYRINVNLSCIIQGQCTEYYLFHNVPETVSHNCAPLNNAKHSYKVSNEINPVHQCLINKDYI